jgi:hypothetical protein
MPMDIEKCQRVVLRAYRNEGFRDRRDELLLSRRGKLRPYRERITGNPFSGFVAFVVERELQFLRRL